MSVEVASDLSRNATRARPATGSTLGPWRLIRVLGEGEWARVFLASPIDATRQSTADYAIKLLKPEYANDPHWMATLQREAFLGQQFSHPHLACVLSAQIERTPSFLVLPYQPGQSVRSLLNRQRQLPVARALWIARQIAEGLAALHERHWLHGDVKPDNCFVSISGHATLCDLGFARTISEANQQRPTLLGTPAYLAPEFLCERAPITPASDIYALGVMLFEMLTGQRPFPHQEPGELAAAHRLLPPPDPSEMVSEISPGLCRLLRQLLAKEPLRRPTGSELVGRMVDLEIDAFGSQY